MPVLVATGDHDPNLASSRDAVKLMPDARLVELENVGHGSVLMQPDLCTEVLLNFVRHYV
jgi:pimeloyl-ACP methyl ester carboxylesterase